MTLKLYRDTMEEKNLKEISVNVRTLVESVLMKGSLAEITSSASNPQEGIKVHRKYQERGIPGYMKEYFLKCSFRGEHIILNLNGKADGIYTDENGNCHIEEIKSIGRIKELPGESGNPLFWMQAKMYGWLYCREFKVNDVIIDLIYYFREDDAERKFSRCMSAIELETECMPVLRHYMEWNDRLQARKNILHDALHDMKFPFSNFRKGQRELSREVFRGIRDGKTVFIQAPTGIGKTMAVLFAGLKAYALGHTDKLFYVTAKNSGAYAAERAMEIINNKGTGVNWVSLTAKAKICFMMENNAYIRPPCVREICPYAADYYDKLPAALEEIFVRSGYDRKVIEELSRKYRLCPFEFSLDLSLFCEVIIADYNYVFDYGAGLKRYFRQGKTNFTILIDEAHNLVDRAREMFSKSVSKKEVLKAKRNCPAGEKKILSKLNGYLLNLKKAYELAHGTKESFYMEYPDGLKQHLDIVLEGLNDIINQGLVLSTPVFALYWELYGMKLVIDRYDETYRCLIKPDKSGIVISLECIDPSKQLTDVIKMQKAAVLFSATLRPSIYFISLISPGLNPGYHEISSPFPPENCLYVINSALSTRWKERGLMLTEYTKLLKMIIAGVPGNIIVFSPSFAFQNNLLAGLGIEGEEAGFYDRQLCIQHPGMMESGRNIFLEKFSSDSNTAGFCVIGGSFSESIDLAGKRLIGVVIFGVGLPQMNLYTDTIRDFFDAKFNEGYNYAFVYPGINRILQAAGRVIRDESDKGFVYLIDDRYETPLYRRLLPQDWHITREKNNSRIISSIKNLLGV